jgi:hypothetical protein
MSHLGNRGIHLSVSYPPEQRLPAPGLSKISPDNELGAVSIYNSFGADGSGSERVHKTVYDVVLSALGQKPRIEIIELQNRAQFQEENSIDSGIFVLLGADR